MEGKELLTAMAAGYPYFYCQTYEIGKTVEVIRDLVEGYVSPKTGENPYSVKLWDFAINKDPEDVIGMLESDQQGLVIVAKNFNWFMIDDYNNPNKGLISLLQANVEEYASTLGRKVLIIVGIAPFSEAIPRDVEKDFLSLSFGLPDMEEITKTYQEIKASAMQSPNFQAPDEDTEKLVLDSCRGMTVRGIKNALAFSLVQEKGRFNPKTVAEIRSQGIESIPGIKVNRSDITFKNLRGYDQIKDFMLATGKSDQSLGFMLLGPAGTGKSTLIRAGANELGYRTYEAEIGAMFGSLVGESEKNMTLFTEFVSANAPCAVILDELEKAIGGSNSGTQDGGTTVRTNAILLKFLSDGRPPGVKVYATCNNISNLPPAWVRAERWDCAPFFVDLPNEDERLDILAYYQEMYKVKGTPKSMEGWSGAEIKSCCRIANMMSKTVEQAERYVVPVSKTMANEIDALRKWAAGKTIPASTEMPKDRFKRSRKVEF